MNIQPIIFIVILFLSFLLSLNIDAQKRCYHYDAAGCRIKRDLSCDPSCSTLVTNTNDTGFGSLRKAIECAQNGDTIFFASGVIGQNITLTSGPIFINKDINIIQSPSTEIFIEGVTRAFQINSGTTKFKHVKIISGCQINYLGTGIRNYGGFIMDRVTVIESINSFCGQASIYNLGQLTVVGNSDVIKQ